MKAETAATKVAWTVQDAVIATVVYVFPTKVPPHVPPTPVVVYPAFGVTIKVSIWPDVAVIGTFGEIVPPVPADGVTVNVAEETQLIAADQSPTTEISEWKTNVKEPEASVDVITGMVVPV